MHGVPGAHSCGAQASNWQRTQGCCGSLGNEANDATEGKKSSVDGREAELRQTGAGIQRRVKGRKACFP